MKKIFTAFLSISVLIIAGCATSQTGNAETDRNIMETNAAEEKDGEKAAVTKIVELPYIVRETSFFSDGYIDGYKVYTYNDDMSLAREDLFDSFDEIIESIVFEELSDGTVKKSLFDAGGSLQSWKMITSSPEGLVTKIESYNSEDKLQTISEYTYDSQGNKTLWTVYDGDKVVLSETEYIYEAGMNIRIDLYDAGLKLREYFVNEYSGGLLIKNTHFDENDKIKAVIEYAYTGSELTKKSYLRANGSISRTVKYTNDDKGSPVKLEYFDGNGKLKDWNEKEYEYISKEITTWK